MDEAVRELAREAGIAADWIDAADQPHRVSIPALRGILSAIGLPCARPAELQESRDRLREVREADRPLVTATVGEPIALPSRLGRAAGAELQLENGDKRHIKLDPVDDTLIVPAIDEPGYHRLCFAARELTLAVAPPRCVTVEDIAPGRRLYGLAVQLYALRRTHDFGFGDTAALAAVVAQAAQQGADAVALSPTHGLFTADPAHYSPYSPSSRLFVNPLYADPAAVFGSARMAAIEPEVAASDLSASGVLIDWPKAAHGKLALLRKVFEDFATHDLPDPASRLASDFSAFERAGGDRLREHALFEALHAHWRTADPSKWDWRAWPPAWRAPGAARAARFAQDQPQAVRFHVFLQWIAERSFAAAQEAARTAGMRIGLISDLAVGMNPAGSHAWSRHQDLLLGLSVGAPPDLFNPRGQNWGLTAISPTALIASGFESFIATLRTALRHAGGVRIDHAMGLSRLWLIPDGASSADGAYLRYPLHDLLRLIALESYRHRAIVIGEDLGTVQPEFRALISACGVAGMDVLWFERDTDAFLPPQRWRRDAVAMTTTHDLPTVAGWWSGADVETRTTLGLVSDRKREDTARAHDRGALWKRFNAAKVASGEEPRAGETARVVDAAIAFVARAPSPLALIPIEDILGLADQPNVPGTTDEHPNWRRRLPQEAGAVLDAPQVRRRLKTLRER